jgi:hypothetical protein
MKFKGNILGQKICKWFGKMQKIFYKSAVKPCMTKKTTDPSDIYGRRLLFNYFNFSSIYLNPSFRHQVSKHYACNTPVLHIHLAPAKSWA